MRAHYLTTLLTPAVLLLDLAWLASLAVAAGSLLAPGSALADLNLFRIEQRSNGFPSPPVTPGGAGQYVGYLIPYYLDVKTGGYNYPARGGRQCGARQPDRRGVHASAVFLDFLLRRHAHPEDRVARLHHDILLSRLQRPWEVRAERRANGPIPHGLPDHGGERGSELRGSAIRSPRPPPSTVGTT